MSVLRYVYVKNTLVPVWDTMLFYLSQIKYHDYRDEKIIFSSEVPLELNPKEWLDINQSERKKGIILWKKEPYVQNLKVGLSLSMFEVYLETSRPSLDWMARNNGIYKVLYKIEYFQS